MKHTAEEFALPIPKSTVRAPLVLEAEELKLAPIIDDKTLPLFGEEKCTHNTMKMHGTGWKCAKCGYIYHR